MARDGSQSSDPLCTLEMPSAYRVDAALLSPVRIDDQGRFLVWAENVGKPKTICRSSPAVTALRIAKAKNGEAGVARRHLTPCELLRACSAILRKVFVEPQGGTARSRTNPSYEHKWGLLNHDVRSKFSVPVRIENPDSTEEDRLR
jgi:hypothetical protein